MIEKPQIATEIKQLVIQKQYEHVASTAAFYLNYMQQKSAEAFAAMKEALTDE